MKKQKEKEKKNDRILMISDIDKLIVHIKNDLIDNIMIVLITSLNIRLVCIEMCIDNTKCTVIKPKSNGNSSFVSLSKRGTKRQKNQLFAMLFHTEKEGDSSQK
jgi:hypothetical protein